MSENNRRKQNMKARRRRRKRDLDNNSKPAVVAVVICAIAVLLIGRLFSLQVIHGREYLTEFQDSIQRKITEPGIRGNIYDRDGNLLAHNEEIRNIVLRDETSKDQNSNEVLNNTIRNVIITVEKHGGSMTSDFGVSVGSGGAFEFTGEGVARTRFLADVYGYADPANMTAEEAGKSAEDVVNDLAAAYGIDTSHEDYSSSVAGRKRLLETVICRYQLHLNNYQKYVGSTIASDVDEKTVEEISRIQKEDPDAMSGVTIETDYKRVYDYPEYFAGILGYTGEISSDELTAKQEEDPNTDYRSGDIIGKLGIESSMEQYLHGASGYTQIYVDNMGRPLEDTATDRKEATTGQDVYLTIDKDLQIAAYKIIEKDLSLIILDRMTDDKGEFTITEETSSSEIIIPSSEVYAACLNNILDVTRFDDADATETEQKVNSLFEHYLSSVVTGLQNELSFSRTPYADLSSEYRTYETWLVSRMYTTGILTILEDDLSDPVYKAWTEDETISLDTFLTHAVSMGWISTEALDTDADTDSSIYAALKAWMLEQARTSSQFARRVYKYMCINEAISGEDVCQLLLDQGIVEVSEDEQDSLRSGSESPYEFMRRRISRLEITPAMLSLDPYCGSCVITDVNTGDVLAMVSYPGYDNNKLSNGADADYYARLQNDASNPMLNYATQQRTAPGSTYKMISATASLLEGVVTTGESYRCSGTFDKIDPPANCWSSSGHGSLRISGAITHSCNVFFYEMGWRLGHMNSSGVYDPSVKYSSDTGIAKLQQYASLYGLDEKSGVEIDESSPHMATGDSVRAAIGQADNSYTTAQLSRYVSTVANSGTCNELTLVDHIEGSGGTQELDKDSVPDRIDMDQEYWDAIHSGMRGVVQSYSFFGRVGASVAGKTGTAQQAKNRPDHALFVGYAPYDEPEISIVTRIPFGYTSSYAVQVSAHILGRYDFENGGSVDSDLQDTLDNLSISSNISTGD